MAGQEHSAVSRARAPSFSPTMSTPRPAAPSEADRWRAWDDFLESTPDTGFMQSSWWTDFRVACGFEHFGITLKANGAIVGGAIVQKFSCEPDSCFYYIQDGPVIPADETAGGQVFEAILD